MEIDKNENKKIRIPNNNLFNDFSCFKNKNMNNNIKKTKINKTKFNCSFLCIIK